MSDDKKTEADKTIGCAIFIISLCVTTPMWMILLFAIMSRVDVPEWAWVLYWVYVPTHVISTMVIAIFRSLLMD